MEKKTRFHIFMTKTAQYVSEKTAYCSKGTSRVIVNHF